MRYWLAMDASPLDQQPDSILHSRLLRTFGPGAENLLKVYVNDSNSRSEAVTQLLGDIVFRMPSVRLAELNNDRQPTFVYLFTYRSLTKGPTGLEYGSMHGLEIPFVFHEDSSLGYSYVGPKGSWTPSERSNGRCLDALRAHGRSEWQRLPVWPRYGTEHATMEFGSHSDVVLDPYGAERKAWHDISSQKFEKAEAARFADPPAE